jgi:hypothetical protein
MPFEVIDIQYSEKDKGYIVPIENKIGNNYFKESFIIKKKS